MYYKINGAWCFDLLLLMLTFALSANLADEDDCCRRLKIFLNGLLWLKFGAPAETRGESTAVQTGFIWHQFPFDLTARVPRRCVFFGERHCYDEMICKTLLPVLAYVTDSQNISERGRHCIGRERATQEASIAKSFDAIIMEVNLQNREIDVYPRSCSARERGKLSEIGGPGWRWCPNTGNQSISIFCKSLGGR